MITMQYSVLLVSKHDLALCCLYYVVLLLLFLTNYVCVMLLVLSDTEKCETQRLVGFIIATNRTVPSYHTAMQ